MAKARIYFDKTNRAYEYEFTQPANPTKENIAFAISEAMVKKNNSASRRNLGRYYTLILKLIGNSNIYPSGNTADTIMHSFEYAAKLNASELPTINGNEITIKKWRCGISQSNRLVIDIDNHEVDNYYEVKRFYEELFGYQFHTILTSHGVWLIGKHMYTNKINWLLDNCRVLNPDLKRADYKEYKSALLGLDTRNGKTTREEIMRSGLYAGIGDFDVMFVFINIKREICTLRISKKTRDDKIIEIE